MLFAFLFKSMCVRALVCEYECVAAIQQSWTWFCQFLSRTKRTEKKTARNTEKKKNQKMMDEWRVCGWRLCKWFIRFWFGHWMQPLAASVTFSNGNITPLLFAECKTNWFSGINSRNQVFFFSVARSPPISLCTLFCGCCCCKFCKLHDSHSGRSSSSSRYLFGI